MVQKILFPYITEFYNYIKISIGKDRLIKCIKSIISPKS